LAFIVLRLSSFVVGRRPPHDAEGSDPGCAARVPVTRVFVRRGKSASAPDLAAEAARRGRRSADTRTAVWCSGSERSCD